MLKILRNFAFAKPEKKKLKLPSENKNDEVLVFLKLSATAKKENTFFELEKPKDTKDYETVTDIIKEKLKKTKLTEIKEGGIKKNEKIKIICVTKKVEHLSDEVRVDTFLSRMSIYMYHLVTMGIIMFDETTRKKNYKINEEWIAREKHGQRKNAIDEKSLTYLVSKTENPLKSKHFHVLVFLNLFCRVVKILGIGEEKFNERMDMITGSFNIGLFCTEKYECNLKKFMVCFVDFTNLTFCILPENEKTEVKKLIGMIQHATIYASVLGHLEQQIDGKSDKWKRHKKFAENCQFIADKISTIRI